LLGGGQADALDGRNLGDGQPLDIVEEHGRPHGDREMGERVPQIVADLDPVQDRVEVDGVGVIAPTRFDASHEVGVFGGHRPVAAAYVEEAVVEHPVQPGAQRRFAAEGVGTGQGPFDDILDEVVGVDAAAGAHQVAGVPVQTGQLGQEVVVGVAGSAHHPRLRGGQFFVLQVFTPTSR